MRIYHENIRESEVEDALISNLDIFRKILGLEKEIRLLTRQLRLVDGKQRLDILLVIGDEIFLIELKADIFRNENIEQILSYKNELEQLQNNKELVPGKIVPVLMVTDYNEHDLKTCAEFGVRVIKYSPLEILTKFFDKISSVAKFIKIRPVDIGVFNIGLINRAMTALEKGYSNINDIKKFSNLSSGSVKNHLKLANYLGLVVHRFDHYHLTDLGIQYISLRDDMISRDDLSLEQATLLRNSIAKNPFSSGIVFGIYAIVESTFFLARNNYPIELDELKQFFLKSSGKKYEWKAPRSLSTATYTYLNYAINLGLLGKIGKQILITPAGFRFILMLQLYKSIEMVETLSPESNR